jgi:hypothetical protein
MRRLLSVIIVLGAALAAGLMNQGQANATSIPVTAYLYHPTGDSSHTASLTCGWHDNCDGIYGDSPAKGLDWIWTSNSSYDVWTRIRIYGGSGQWVAQGILSNSTYGCYRIWEDINGASSGAYIGTVTEQHSRNVGGGYENFYTSGSGILNSAVVGSMIMSGDNCNSSGPHDMQWYYNYSGTNTTKNTSIPDEHCCNYPYNPYGYLTTYEYLWNFSS